jgi:hypothetical protein
MPSYHAMSCHVVHQQSMYVVNSTPPQSQSSNSPLLTQIPYPDRRPGCQESPALALPCLLHAQLVYSHPDSLVGLNAEHMFASRASRLAPACIALHACCSSAAVSADEKRDKGGNSMLAGRAGWEKGQGFFWSESVSVYVRWYIGRQMGQKSFLFVIVCR